MCDMPMKYGDESQKLTEKKEAKHIEKRAAA